MLRRCCSQQNFPPNKLPMSSTSRINPPSDNSLKGMSGCHLRISGIGLSSWFILVVLTIIYIKQ